jgi:hypothetical protein
MMRGLRPRRSVRTAMAHGACTPRVSPILDSLISYVAAIAEVMMYGIVQKDGLGMDRAIEECKYRMSVRALETTPLRARLASHPSSIR